MVLHWLMGKAKNRFRKSLKRKRKYERNKRKDHQKRQGAKLKPNGKKRVRNGKNDLIYYTPLWEINDISNKNKIFRNI